MTEQPYHTNSSGMNHFFLSIGTVEYEDLLVVITHPFRSHISYCNNPYIKPTIVHLNQATGWGHNDHEYFTLRSFDIGTAVQSGLSGRNIDNRTGVNLKGTIGTIITDIESKRISPFKDLSHLTNWNASGHD